MPDCIFCDIGRGQTDSELLFSDDRCFVIRDIAPLAPTHLLIIPYMHMTSLGYIGPGQEALFGHLFAVAEEMARREGATLSGYRLTLNQGQDSGQEIEHLHMHLLAGQKLGAMG